MVAWASQGGGGFRKAKMGLRNEYRALVPLNRSLSDYWNSQGCEMCVRVAKCVRKPSQISQGILGVRNEFTQTFQISQGKTGLGNFRKVNFGFVKFRKVNLG